jgi:hypothetical protein
MLYRMRRLFAGPVLLLAIALASAPGLAARDCDYFGNCNSYIPHQRLPSIAAQQTMVWCWAAAAQALFRYHGYEVSQQRIVMQGYGSLVVSTGSPAAVLRTLNTEYVDERDGRRFRVRTTKHVDAFSWLAGDPWTASLQTGLSNSEIFESLRQEKPVFYGSQSHAMVLVAAGHRGDMPFPNQSWVLDPAPAIQVPFAGPITDPRIPAIGIRPLMLHEMAAYFVALVDVRPVP